MTTVALPHEEKRIQDAGEIPALGHAEAGEMARLEAGKVLALLESLQEDDWEQPTECTEWTVRDMVAHLSGSVAGYASWAEFKRQFIANPYLGEAEMKVDGVNRRQVEDRKSRSVEELITEFREDAPRAIRTRQRLPWLLRKLPLPFGPPLGFTTVEYLMDVIYTRDEWMHRQDIARATGREFALTAQYDGRMLALVLRDLAHSLKSHLGERRIDLIVPGPAGGHFRFGSGKAPTASIEIDLFTLNRLASGRIAATEALAHASLAGERESALWFLRHCEVPY